MQNFLLLFLTSVPNISQLLSLTHLFFFFEETHLFIIP